ncbi:MAG: hypothetical protein ACE5FJ_04815, partial [Gemmatimonadales bacterium]
PVGGIGLGLDSRHDAPQLSGNGVLEIGREALEIRVDKGVSDLALLESPQRQCGEFSQSVDVEDLLAGETF